MKCPKCTCIKATAWLLTKRDAEEIAASIAKQLQQVRPLLADDDAFAEACQMILLKKPELVIQCDGCKYRWFE